VRDPTDIRQEPSSSIRRRSAIVVLGAFIMWMAGILILFPADDGAIPPQALRSQAEARNSLRELARKQFDHQRRKGRFEYDFNVIGFRPDPPVRYVIAFPASCTAKYSSPMAVTSSLEILSRGIASNDLRPRTLTVAERALIEAQIETSASLECPDPAVGFKALAIGNLDDDPDLDVWAVDANLDLVQLKSDL